jgi:hypothetical protein
LEPQETLPAGSWLKSEFTSSAEKLAKKNPWTHIVAAFQTVPSEVLFPAGIRRSLSKAASSRKRSWS